MPNKIRILSIIRRIKIEFAREDGMILMKKLKEDQ